VLYLFISLHVCLSIYNCTLYILRKDQLQLVQSSFLWSFDFLSNLWTGNRKFSESVQLQLEVWPFAVGFSSVPVICSVQSTGPANTSGAGPCSPSVGWCWAIVIVCGHWQFTIGGGVLGGHRHS